MYFGITPLSEHSGNDTETAPPKTAIAETPYIDTTHISNAADTAIFHKHSGKTLIKHHRRISQER